jgi:hypothetical protein
MRARIRVPEIGIRVPEIGIRVPEIGIRVPEIGIRVPIIGIRVPEIGIRVPIIGIRVPEIGIRVPIIGIRVPIIGIRVPIAASWALGMHHCPVVKRWDRPARLAATETKKPAGIQLGRPRRRLQASPHSLGEYSRVPGAAPGPRKGCARGHPRWYSVCARGRGAVQVAVWGTTAVACLVVGAVLTPVFPANKQLWSPSCGPLRE